MKVAVIHYSLRSIGGGEQVCLSTIEALNRLGITPELYLREKVDQEFVLKSYGKNIKLNICTPKFDIAPGFFKLYSGLFYKMMPREFSKYDLVIDTSGEYVHVSPFPKKYILYVHNPTVHLLSREKRKGVFWRAYWAPYEYFLRKSIREYRKRETKIICNSDFTKNKVKKLWQLEAETIYPPVMIDDFLSSNEGKRDGVISVGRFSFEKNHVWQLQAAQRLPRITFRICGSAMTSDLQQTFRALYSKAKEMKLNNVEFYPNISFKEMVELMHKSRYFIHTMKDEDFGITICEAIASGCIPIVHNSGGPMEIVPFRELRFESVEDVVKILSDQNRQGRHNELQAILSEHVKQYREEIFQEKIIGIVRGQFS